MQTVQLRFRLTLSLAILMTALSGRSSDFASRTLPSGDGLSLTERQGERLDQALTPMHREYDPEAQMLRTRFSSPGYHTTLKGGYVHRTRRSLNYAVALMDTGDESLAERAQEILNRVIALQDQDPASKTYGIWSWFLEEPLDQMAPPDWNWADFCGTALLQVALDHRGRLPEALNHRIHDALRHATFSIRRRNVGPGYTNIALMGTYVTMMTAELLEMPDLKEYAMKRLRRFHEYTLTNGGFTEYNSPTYTIVALEELGRMRMHFIEPEARKLVEEIYEMAWRDIALHFHPPTRQWAGPHSRAYRNRVSGGFYDLLQEATDHRVDFGVNAPRLDSHRIPLPCPESLEPYFQTLESPREQVQTFVRREPPVVGTSYLTPRFALSSVNRSCQWNQRRNLLAYWGSAENPAHLQLRFLHDGYDFSSAQFFSVQQEGRVLVGLNLATNGGDTHISLDRLKEGRVTGKDFRVRFQFGGSAADITLPEPDSLMKPVRLEDVGVHFTLQSPTAQWNGRAGRWEAGRDEETAWLDLVLYSGPEKEFQLADFQDTAVGFGLSMADDPTPSLDINASLKENGLSLEWGNLELKIPTLPASESQLQKTFHTHR